MLGVHGEPGDAGQFDMPVISLYPRAFAHKCSRSARGEHQQQQQLCVSSFTIGEEEEEDGDDSPACSKCIKYSNKEEASMLGGDDDCTLAVAGSNG